MINDVSPEPNVTIRDKPLKCHGGKHYLAKQIVAMMPPHIHYVEPFFGGGAVLLERDPGRNWAAAGGEAIPRYEQGCSEVVNDLNGDLTNFWRVLQQPSAFNEFMRRIEATPCSEAEYDAADRCRSANNVERAAAFFILCRQSRAARFKEFTTLSKTRTRRQMNELPSAWLSAIASLPAVHARLRRVVILNRDAFDVIREQDAPRTLFYCDPPYCHDTRKATTAYVHEMTSEQHRELLDILSGIKGKFILSGYRNDLYDRAAEAAKWHRRDIQMPNHAAGGKTKREMTESLWTNYEPAAVRNTNLATTILLIT